MSKTTILFVDNDPDFLSARSELLERDGYQTVRAKSGAEAKTILDQQKVDLAVVDVRLTKDEDERDTSGIALARTLTVPVIILTSYADYRLTRNAFTSAESVVDVIAKQDGISALSDAIASILQQRDATQKSVDDSVPKPARVRLDVDAQLEDDYNEIRKQVRLNHRIALGLAVVFCVTLVLILAGQTAIGTLSIFSSAVSGISSSVFGWLYRDASKRQDRYHDELIKQYDKQHPGGKPNRRA